MKYVSAAEFKAKCLKLMDEVQATGEPITVTKRGKPVVEISSAWPGQQPRSIAEAMKGSVLFFDPPDGPVADPKDWHALT